ncbi:MAG: ribonuclease III [Oscillospiraceae bacterium]|nr:ribonuclease III [Oscillospiraceae bacterium]
MDDRLGLAAVERVLGYRFGNPALLLQALTHPSYAAQHGGADNQRLEYLGDAVLQLCVSRRLYDLYPNLPEGQLSRRRAALVCEASLCRAARRFGLGGALRLDHGESATGGRDKPSILADAMEAVIAAAYLDGGLDAATALVDQALGRYDPGGDQPVDAKTTLQERLQAQGRPAPSYLIVGEQGPPHARVFTAQALLDGQPCGQGSGASKKQAEQQAAQQALAALDTSQG